MSDGTVTDGTSSVALDFDGSLVEDHVLPLRWRRGAKEFVVAAAAAGVRMWVHSCRCAVACNLSTVSPWDAEEFWRSGRVAADIETSWAHFEEMRVFLEVEGVWAFLTPWTLPGKPFADLYVDDKAELPDWYRLAGELGVRLGHAIQGGPGTIVPERRPGPAGSGGAPGSASAGGADSAAPPGGLRLHP